MSQNEVYCDEVENVYKLQYLLNRKTCNLLFQFLLHKIHGIGVVIKQFNVNQKPHINNYNHTNNYNTHMPNRKTYNLPFHSLLNEKWVYKTD